MDAPWRIELLGGLRVVQGARVVDRFRYRKTGALLAYLAFYRERTHLRDEMSALLWPQCDLSAGRLRLRGSLNSLRRQLELPGVPAGAVIRADRSRARAAVASGSAGVPILLANANAPH